MFAVIGYTLAMDSVVLTAIYWICAILGGGLLFISTLSGLHGHADVDADAGAASELGGDFHGDADAEFDADAGANVDAAGHVDAAHAHVDHTSAVSLSSWLSVRFVVYFLAVFGMIGLVLTYLTTVGPWLILSIAVISGVAVGQIVQQAIMALRRTSGNSTTRPEDYVNRLGRVTIAFATPDTGEVMLQVRGGQRYVPARGRRTQAAFAKGDEVVVVGYRGGLAEVISREDFAQLNG